jgi:hypothetical protein
VADYCNSPDTLTLAVGSTTLDLMSDQQGFRVSALDLGYPAVREVVIDNPDRNGATDLTKLLGPRPVVITGALVPSPAGSRQMAWHALAPFLDPSARVTMTYRVDADAVIKTMTLRAAQATATFDNPSTSPAQLGFKAADPLAYGATQIATVLPYATSAGRAYNLTFNRVYPSTGITTVTTWNRGDLTAFPLLRLYGPASGGISIQFTTQGTAWMLYFLAGFSINAGDRLDIDSRNRTMYLNGDATQNRYSQVDFGRSTGGWPYIPAGGSTVWYLNAGTYSTTTQLQVNWADAYLL